MSIQRIALRDIVANPYRKIESYRISEIKIEALIQSYDSSGFWDGSIQARPHPTREGKFEIAFGHHRIEAARRQRLGDVGLVVAKRSDADMLRMMAHENREEFKGDHLVAIETIEATVEAFGRGEIALDAVEPQTPKSAVYVAPGGATYTCGTIARFLGWTKRHGEADPEPTRACRLAFEAYHERSNIVPALQRLPEDDRTRQTTAAVLSAVKSARHALRHSGKSAREVDAAALRAANEAIKQIKTGAIASKVKDEAAKIGRAAAGVERNAKEITPFVHDRAAGLRARAVNLENDIDALLNDVLPYRDQLTPEAEADLLQSLTFADTRLRALFEKWTERLTRTPARNITPQRRRLHA